MCYATKFKGKEGSDDAATSETTATTSSAVKNISSPVSQSALCPEPEDTKRKTLSKVPSLNPVPKKKRGASRKVRFAPPASASTTSSCSSSNSCYSSSDTVMFSRNILNASVRADVISTHKPASAMTEEEIADVHWSTKDYEFFRGTARLIASEIVNLSSKQRKSSQNYDTVMARSYQECAERSVRETASLFPNLRDNASMEAGASSTTTAHTSAAEEKMDLSPQLFEKLTQWVRAGHSRRGLEKFCVMHHIEARPMAKKTSMQAVLAAQHVLRLCREETGNDNNSQKVQEARRTSLEKLGIPPEITSLPDDEILKIVSEQFTRTSKLYALAMGHADAAALGLYQQK